MFDPGKLAGATETLPPYRIVTRRFKGEPPEVSVWTDEVAKTARGVKAVKTTVVWVRGD